MNTKEILSIVALAALGVCLICSLAKAAMKKGDKGKKHCDKACGAFVFLAIILLAVSQLMDEPEKFGDNPLNNCTRVTGKKADQLDCCPLGGCTENKPACNGSGGDWWCYTQNQTPDSKRTKPCCRDYKYNASGYPIYPDGTIVKPDDNTGLCGGTNPPRSAATNMDITCGKGLPPVPSPPPPTPTPVPKPNPDKCTIDYNYDCHFPLTNLRGLKLTKAEKAYLIDIPTDAKKSNTHCYYAKNTNGDIITSCCNKPTDPTKSYGPGFGCCDPTNTSDSIQPPGVHDSGGNCHGSDPSVLPCCTEGTRYNKKTNEYEKFGVHLCDSSNVPCN